MGTAGLYIQLSTAFSTLFSLIAQIRGQRIEVLIPLRTHVPQLLRQSYAA